MSATALSDQAPGALPSEQAPSGDATIQPASTNYTKSSSDGVTGLTPDQVFQELKKSGYVDQLRRQMFDAFTAASTPLQTSSVTPSKPTLAAPNGSQNAASASTSASQPSAASNNAETATSDDIRSTSAPNSAPAPALAVAKPTSGAEAQQTVDVGSKAAFLQFLAAPLRYHVEKEHDTLRFEDQRGQQNKLLKLLESDHVKYPGSAEHGDATLYDLLVRHFVAASPTASAAGATGMLAKDGTVGREGYGRIAETINEMLHPAGKDGEEEEDDDDEDVDEDEPEGGTDPNPQPGSEALAQISHNGAAQSSHATTSDMDQD